MPPLDYIDGLMIAAAYALGSISSAILVCRLMQLPDPRTQGSGNPGATNVLRVGGKGAAAITLAGDLLKGLLPVALAHLWDTELAVLALIGSAAFLGHLYPLFFQFRGGKGVATGLGVLLGASWPVGLATALTWLAMARLTRISSLSALTAFLLAPAYAWWFTGDTVFIVCTTLISLLVFWRHRSNIHNLLTTGTD